MGNAHVKPHPKPRNKKQVRWKAADRPSPPGKPSLVQENGSVPDVVHICWPKPEKDKGSTVSAYLVEHKRLGSTNWVKSSPLPVLGTELSVNDLDPGWRYQFRVRAENAVGLSDPSEISEPFTVTLQRLAITAPKFTQDLKDTAVLENGKVELEVHFLGQPAPSICWFKDGFEIFSGNRTRITTVSDKSILSILQTTAADEGEIKCTATNRAGHASTKSKFIVEAPPSIRLPKSYQDQDGIIFEIGETIRLNVSVGGRPTPLVFWSHDGESIQNDDRHELEYIDKTASVKIESALRSDRGEYQIRAVNKLGQDVAAFLVTITDKPTPPGKARVLLTSGKSVTLSWSTPEDDGGCKIGNYIIEYYRVGWNVWLKAATSRQLSTMLGDLIEGSQYKFRVKAESPYGVSEPSEESETVFIPDPKRGISEPEDVTGQSENESLLPIDLRRRRRANSSPRVSFVLREEVPIRPERKKTGKTPEASPRMKRRQIPSPSDQNNDFFGMNNEKPQFSRNFSMPNSDAQLSPIISRKKFNKSPKLSPTFSLKRQMAFSFPEVTTKQASPTKPYRDKTKSPSPDIIITDTEKANTKEVEKLTPKRSNRSPNRRRRSFSEGNDREKSKSSSPTSVKSSEFLTEDRTTRNMKSDNRIRPPLTRQDFSGSSEFMLVLCPEGEQGAQFKKLGISFEENSLPPPLSLSAPELGIEPPEQPMLRRSASSTELLNYRLMERLNEAAQEEEERAEIKRNEDMGRTVSLDIPMIQVNSKPTQELVGLEPKPSQNRRLSAGVVVKQPKWSQKRRSLKSPSEISSVLDTKLHKFPETSDSKREVQGYREYIEYEDHHEENDDIDKDTDRRRSVNSDEWMKDYEESISSEEESESSIEEGKYSKIVTPRSYTDEVEEETYNPRTRMMSAVKVDHNDKPFEILTIRKEPPDSSIIPKPILKKKMPNNTEHSKFLPFDQQTSMFIESDIKRTRSRSLIDSPDDPRALPLGAHVNQRDRSNSLIGTHDELIDVTQIKKSPNNIKRRSFSLIPGQANFMKDAFKNTNKKGEIPSSPTKVNPAMNISALANFTSIAGAGMVIPENLIGRQDAREESKVAVDFYGDIVKSFGGKPKPTAEFSRSIVSKYDTYEERKISEIKSNIDTQDKQRAQMSASDNFAKSRAKSPPRKIERQDTVREVPAPQLPQTNKVSSPQIQAPDLPSNTFKSPSKKIERQDTAREIYTPSFVATSKSSVSQMTSDDLSSSRTQKSEKQDKEREVYTPQSSQMKNASVSASLTQAVYSKPTNPTNIVPRGRATTPPYPEIINTKVRTPSKSPMRPSSRQDINVNRSPSPVLKAYRRPVQMPERPPSRSASLTRRRKPPKSRDASTSPVRFENWESRSSSRNSLDRDYYNRGSLTSSRASSLTRRSPSPVRPKLREITTQTSFRIEPKTPADILKKQEELASKAEKRVKGLFEYLTDLAMVSVASWLYLFQNEYLAIPILLILVYRQLSEEMIKLKSGLKKRMPRWIVKRWDRKDKRI